MFDHIGPSAVSLILLFGKRIGKSGVATATICLFHETMTEHAGSLQYKKTIISVSNCSLFNFFNYKFDYLSYLKFFYKYYQIYAIFEDLVL